MLFFIKLALRIGMECFSKTGLHLKWMFWCQDLNFHYQFIILIGISNKKFLFQTEFLLDTPEDTSWANRSLIRWVSMFFFSSENRKKTKSVPNHKLEPLSLCFLVLALQTEYLKNLLISVQHLLSFANSFLTYFITISQE